MNDDFIYMSLPKVRREFAMSLYARISLPTHPTNPQKFFLRRPWLKAALIALGLLILVAWSQIRMWVRYVPVGNLWIIEFNRATETVPDEPPIAPFVPTPWPTWDPSSTQIPEGTRIQIFIPTWVPDGFHDIENLHNMMFNDATVWMWDNDAGEKIRLHLIGKAGGMRPYAPEGMWKEVQVDGQSAILIYGRLALTSPENPRAQREWDESLGLQLYWDMGKYIYALETYGQYLSEQDLIRMAESAMDFTGLVTPTP